jgi:hypothetical protein
MRLIFSLMLALALVPSAFSQGAPPGFPMVNNSNILHPSVPPVGIHGVSPRPYTRGEMGGRRYFGRGTILVPYPVYADPFYTGGPGFDPGYNPAYPPDQMPTVIINQNFQPETIHPQLKDYSNVTLPEPGVVIPAPGTPAPAAAVPPQTATPDDGQPNIYLIALNDQSVLTALAYWVQGDTLNYITLTDAQNHVSLALVDRDLSIRLNRERQVQFRLPAAH